MATVMDRLRGICLALPETTEEVTWGTDILDDPRFALAAYVGRYGWLTMQLTGFIDWDEVASLVRGSYRLIAPTVLAREVP